MYLSIGFWSLAFPVKVIKRHMIIIQNSGLHCGLVTRVFHAFWSHLLSTTSLPPSHSCWFSLVFQACPSLIFMLFCLGPMSLTSCLRELGLETVYRSTGHTTSSVTPPLKGLLLLPSRAINYLWVLKRKEAYWALALPWGSIDAFKFLQVLSR